MLEVDESNFDQIRLALYKSARGRSYDDLLNLRNFIFQLDFVKKYFADVYTLDYLNDFCRGLGIEDYLCGECVFSQGDVSDKLYFLISGEIDMRVKHRVGLAHGEFEDREKVDAKVSVGMVFGESALESDEVRQSTAKIFSQTAIVISISKTTMKSLGSETQNMKKDSDLKPGSKAYVLDVLSKRREARTADEVEIVATYMKPRIPFFAKFNDDQQFELCRIAGIRKKVFAFTIFMNSKFQRRCHFGKDKQYLSRVKLDKHFTSSSREWSKFKLNLQQQKGMKIRTTVTLTIMARRLRSWGEIVRHHFPI